MNPTMPTISLTLTEYNSLPVCDFHHGAAFAGDMWRDRAGRVRILMRRADRAGIVVGAAAWVRVKHRRLSTFPPGWLECACGFLWRWPRSGAGVWLVRREHRLQVQTLSPTPYRDHARTSPSRGRARGTGGMSSPAWGAPFHYRAARRKEARRGR